MSRRTLKDFGFDEIIEKKSRFIGYAAPADTEEEALSFINRVKNEHKSATHNVYAYIIDEGSCERASDDGEPSGTAGVPVLNVIKKEELTHCVVVVTRYFGGTLLGAGGLIRAYSAAAKAGIDAAGIATLKNFSVYSVDVSYELLPILKNKLPEISAEILDISYGETVKVKVCILEGNANLLEKTVVEVTSGRFSAEFIETTEKGV